MDIDTNVVDSLNIFGLQHYKIERKRDIQKMLNIVKVFCLTLTFSNIENMLDFSLLYIQTNSEH